MLIFVWSQLISEYFVFEIRRYQNSNSTEFFNKAKSELKPFLNRIFCIWQSVNLNQLVATCPEYVETLISHCCDPDATKRPTFQQIFTNLVAAPIRNWSKSRILKRFKKRQKLQEAKFLTQSSPSLLRNDQNISLAEHWNELVDCSPQYDENKSKDFVNRYKHCLVNDNHEYNFRHQDFGTKHSMKSVSHSESAIVDKANYQPFHRCLPAGW